MGTRMVERESVLLFIPLQVKGFLNVMKSILYLADYANPEHK